ncbi:MAG: hypothetical protein I8H68_03325 [Flavobacteriia bacterium]|nr:hypothetical protein [Flavobacteriia bacterium]MBH2023351.1 hypothetical protein [Flavobacteriales bacterium]
MRQLLLNKDFANKDFLKSLIDDFIDDLKIDKNKNQKKILELCHVAKFLTFFEDKFKIERISEEPDFIIFSTSERIGLEHQILIDTGVKEKEGFIENLFKQAEQILSKGTDVPSFLANIYIYPNLEIKINDKSQKIIEIVDLLKNYLKTGKLYRNDIIEDINIMPHSQISLNPNFGGWCQKNITSDLLLEAISKKERLVNSYIKKTNLKQWLLIVIGGLGESSYEYDLEFDIDVESKFENIFLMEDFSCKLYEIK